MLRIIITMFGDVLKFIFIWSVVLICLTSVAYLLFGELTDYKSFIEVFFTIFGTGMGNYDLEVFEDLSLGKVLG